MITYDKLWETMEKRHMTQYRLIRYYGISAGQIGRLKKICMCPLIRWKYSVRY